MKKCFWKPLALVHKLEHSLTATTFYKKNLFRCHSGSFQCNSGSFRSIPVTFRFIPVHSGPFRCHSGSFRAIPVHSVFIPVHSGSFRFIPVHSGPFRCHSGSFRSIPRHSGSFRSISVFSNARIWIIGMKDTYSQLAVPGRSYVCQLFRDCTSPVSSIHSGW